MGDSCPPCEVCGFSDWPAGGMHAARSIHMRAHERGVKTQPKGTIMSDVDEAEWERDVLRALLTYAVDQLDEQASPPLPPVDF